MTRPADVAGLLLAAGGSRRLGQPKQLLPTSSGEALVQVMARRLLDAGCGRVLVVLGAHADAVREALVPLLVDARGERPAVQTITHAEWTGGMGTTIAAGVTVLEQDPTLRGVLIAACDMPTVTAAHLCALLRAAGGDARAQGQAAIGRVASTYRAPQGDLLVGVPALFPRADFAALMQLQGDRGARALLQGTDPLVALDDGALDLDTLEDVQRWRTAGAQTIDPAATG